jgi:hypothetical protein
MGNKICCDCTTISGRIVETHSLGSQRSERRGSPQPRDGTSTPIQPTFRRWVANPAYRNETNLTAAPRSIRNRERIAWLGRLPIVRALFPAWPAGMSDDDGIGPDGMIRLRCYLPSADSMRFSAGCGCGRERAIGVRQAIEAMRCAAATVGQLGRRLRCSGCGSRMQIASCPDTRPADVQRRDGPRPETRAGLSAGTPGLP